MTTPDLDIYPDEKSKLATAMARLSSAFEFTSFSERTKPLFEEAARNEFGRIGFEVHVTWSQIYEKDPNPLIIGGEVPTGVWLPNIEVCGRITQESETDHDRVKWGVVRGLDDGVAGYIRADGTLTEEPRKKNIY